MFPFREWSKRPFILLTTVVSVEIGTKVNFGMISFPRFRTTFPTRFYDRMGFPTLCKSHQTILRPKAFKNIDGDESTNSLICSISWLGRCDFIFRGCLKWRVVSKRLQNKSDVWRQFLTWMWALRKERLEDCCKTSETDLVRNSEKWSYYKCVWSIDMWAYNLEAAYYITRTELCFTEK